MTLNALSRGLAAALLASTLATPVLAADPIRVGFLTVKSGALAAGGKQMEDGLRLFLKERNNMIAGRKVELVVADTAGQPAITKTKTQELVEKDHVNVIIGPLAAFEALAIDDYIRSTETLNTGRFRFGNVTSAPRICWARPISRVTTRTLSNRRFESSGG